MDCRDKIVWEDYRSLILDFRLEGEVFPEEGELFCYREVEDPIGVLYVDKSVLPPLSASRIMYRYIPQLYGLEGFPAGGSRDFDPGPLEASGILAQQQPPLELTGRGGFLAAIAPGFS